MKQCCCAIRAVAGTCIQGTCENCGGVTYKPVPAPLPPPDCEYLQDVATTVGDERDESPEVAGISAALAGETRTEARTNSGGNMQKQLRSRDVIGKDGLWTTEPWPDSGNYHDPTPEMLANPLWNAIWQEIKHWDINVPSQYSGHSGATGNHVTAIFNAITNSRRKDGAV